MNMAPDQEAVEAPAQYDTKTIQYHSPEQATQFGIMMTAVEARDNRALRQEGYRGRYMFFVMLAGGVADASHDPMKIRHGANTTGVRDFMMGAREGWQSRGDRGIPWPEIEDGSTVTPGDVEDWVGQGW